MGPGGLIPGNYNASSLSQSQRQWLYNYYGHQGNAPSGYGGENSPGETSNYSVGETASQAEAQNAAAYAAQQPQELLNLAGSINAQTIQQSQPEISTLQQYYNPSSGSGILSQQYGSILNQIVGAGSAATGIQSNVTNTQLAQRGILPSSLTGQETLANTLLPMTQQIGSTEAGFTQQYGQQVLGIGSTIGALQSGSPALSLNSAQGLLNLQAPQENFAGTVGPTYQNLQLAGSLAGASLGTTGLIQTTGANEALYNPANNTANIPLYNALIQMGMGTQQAQTLLMGGNSVAGQ